MPSVTRILIRPTWVPQVQSRLGGFTVPWLAVWPRPPANAAVSSGVRSSTRSPLLMRLAAPGGACQPSANGSMPENLTAAAAVLPTPFADMNFMKRIPLPSHALAQWSLVPGRIPSLLAIIDFTVTSFRNLSLLLSPLGLGFFQRPL